MNIFVLDYNPKICAQYHCDKHVVKMILESVQMICTTHNLYGLDTPYKTTHANHPCSLWVRKSKHNYMWLCDLIEELHEEWKYRFDHICDLDGESDEHKSYVVFKNLDHKKIINMLPDIDLQPFAQAMPEELISNEEDAVGPYRAYYATYKKDLLKYTKREVPEWIMELQLS